MSGMTILKTGLIAGASITAMTLGACASSGYADGNGASRYGNVYDYESGGACNTAPACGAVAAQPVTSTRYGSAVTTSTVVGQAAPVYVAPAPAPAPVYQQPVYQQQVQYSGPVSCPAGTTPNGDGTCMQSGSGYSQSTTQVYDQAPPASCPAGTTPSNDGTCLQSGSAYTTDSYSGSQVEIYTDQSPSTPTEMADCPAGTTPNGDGTCMQSGSGYSQSTTQVYDNTTSGYQAPADYVPPVYQPIRK